MSRVRLNLGGATIWWAGNGRSHAHLSKDSSVTNCGTRALRHVISVEFIAHIHSSVPDNSTDVGTVRILLDDFIAGL